MCIVCSRLAVKDLSDRTHALAKSDVSYSYTKDGTIYYSKINEDKHTRYIHIFGVLSLV